MAKTELEDCQDENSTLKRELVKRKAAGLSDTRLLASGLRLAQANESLVLENTRLKHAAEQSGKDDVQKAASGAGVP